MGTIRIEALEVEAIIGTLPGEREASQTLSVTLEVETDTRGASLRDDLAAALDYRQLAARIRALAEAGRFQLVETLAERAALDLQQEVEGVGRVTIEVRKTGAIPGTAFVGVRVERPGAVRYRIGNPSERRLQLILEPWGDVLPLEPRVELELEFHADRDGRPEVEGTDVGYVVYAWPTARLKVYEGGRLVSRYDDPAPDVPDTLTTSDFVRWLSDDASQAAGATTGDAA